MCPCGTVIRLYHEDGSKIDQLMKCFACQREIDGEFWNLIK